MKKPVVLRIFKGDQLLGVKQFVDSQIVLGRPGDVQVPLDGQRVSLIHAAIEERDTGYFICDLGSENGTFKNGEPVLDAPIESGDIIQVGEFRIEFFVGVPKPKTPGTVDITNAAKPAPAQASASAPSKPQIPPVAPASVAPTVKPSAPPQAKAPQASTAKPAPAASKQEPKSQMPASTVAGAQASVLNNATASPISAAQLDPFPTPASRSGVGLAGPRGAKSSKTPTSKREKTFAPPSKYKDARDFVKPSKGTVVEVLVAWRERIIESRHFSEAQKTVTLGSDPGCDIVLPLLSSRVRKMTLLKIDRVAKVYLSPEMSGELIRGQGSSSINELVKQNKVGKDGAQNVITLEQGEMVRVELNDQISIFVRYTSDSPKPLVAPVLDLTAAEFTGVILAGVLIAILRLYTFLYTPPVALPGDDQQEPVRIAIVATPTPVPPISPPQPKAEETPAPTPPPPVVKATPQPTKAPDIKQAAAKPKEKPATNLTTKNDPGKSANAAPNKNKTGPRQLTSPKQGGAIKTTPKEGSQMNSAKRDVTKSGVFSAFGSNGAQDRLAQETSGSGALVGLADAATGRSGQSENRAGQGLGSATKDTGVGGTGKAMLGIHGGIGTSGRGSGNSGYGTGGLGNKAGTKIVTGGSGEAFSGTIDREAIRRVLKANERTIKTCYERQLNRNPDLFGKLVLTWDIADGGRALNVHVSSNELGNADVANCIMDRLKTWKFPDPPSNQQVEVSYPWFFSN